MPAALPESRPTDAIASAAAATSVRNSTATSSLACRPRCGACCIAPSITSPIPGMPDGKPAGVPCIQLDSDLRCRLFGRPERPAFCGGLQPSHEMCGDNTAHAMRWLTRLEAATRPA